jgi:hypothetical protein
LAEDLGAVVSKQDDVLLQVKESLLEYEIVVAES